MSLPADVFVLRRTVFSDCRAYRYTLWREWDLFISDYALFIGLNPSTADEIKDDPTIRRCIGFCKSWGLGALCMANLFAYRATLPADMMAAEEPVGADNDSRLVEIARGAKIVIAAWGADGGHLGRDAAVSRLLDDAGIAIHCLGTTKQGQPRHPLYVKGDTQPARWTRRPTC